jgi:hypothetical protein
MPFITFDLEDGLPEVSFTLKPNDAERFMAFMAECNRYMKQRDTAWVELRKIREAIKANPEESTFDEVVKVVSQGDELLTLVKGAHSKQNSEYLTLLAKYAGTKFESDPVIQKLKTWVKNADELIAKAEATQLCPPKN